MNRDIVKVLLSDARTKPQIAELVERAEQMSDDDIMNAVVPLPWYRKALTQYRNQLLVSKIEVAPPRDNIVTGAILRYTGPTTELRPPGRMTIPIEHGALLFKTDTELWLGAMVLGNPGIKTETVEPVATRQAYTTMISTFSDVVEDATGVRQNGMFRISRI